MDWFAPLWETFHITFFVMIVMMLMEFIELYRMRRHREKGGKIRIGCGRRWRYVGQLAGAALLGLLPGCVGGIMVVGLYTHRAVSFGAVLAAAFTALGDDAFRMLAMDPIATVEIELLLLAMGLAAGFLADRFGIKKRFATPPACRIELHDDDREHAGHEAGEVHGAGSSVRFRFCFKNWSFARTLLVILLGVYIVSLVGGVHLHDHGVPSAHGFHLDFEHAVFFVLALAALALVLSVHEHFLQEHLWNHLLKKHFPAIFFWTIGTLYLLAFIQQGIDIQAWLSNDLSRQALLLFAAILIGWIPQSGPHFLFIQLYFSGALPFGIFFANAIVQDGHTSLLLLAESRKKFIWLKSVKTVVALLVCSFLLFW